MRPKPTREAVEEMLTDFEAHELIGSRRDVYEFVVSVIKDWLAQGEELERLRSGDFTEEEFQNLCHKVSEGDGPERFSKGCIAYQKQLFGYAPLEAENQALKASMEADYIERQAKHIQELVKENGELKATRVEWQLNLGIVPPDKEGQPLHYTADDATGDEGNEGGQP